MALAQDMKFLVAADDEDDIGYDTTSSCDVPIDAPDALFYQHLCKDDGDDVEDASGEGYDVALAEEVRQLF